MGGIHHQPFHVFFSREDEHQFRPDAFVAPTNETAVSVAPATVIGRWVSLGCAGTQYPENGIDEFPVIHCLAASAAFSSGQVVFNQVALMVGEVVAAVAELFHLGIVRC